MCFSIYLSTTSTEDLAKPESELIQLETIKGWVPEPLTDEDDSVLDRLNYPNKWCLVSRYGGCSCGYRHLCSGSDFDFGPPEDWCPEDDDDIESTQAAYDLFARLLVEGHQVDVLDVWTGTSAEAITTMVVRLCEVPRDHFRFFEGVRFEFS
ncbi:MAG: hypothetical protein M9921_13440 [Fimbriimonadaceae bacterium]|nr:hypothetical protein [Fimbriimonadaceae bacterium]